MSGAEPTKTPPFQNSKPVGLCTRANSITLSATPSRFSSGRMRRRSSISLSGSHLGYVFQAATQSRPLVSTDICTGFTISGNIFSEAKRLTLKPSGTRIFFRLSSGLR